MNEIDFYKINETLDNKYYQIPQELFVNRLYKEKLNLKLGCTISLKYLPPLLVRIFGFLLLG